MLSCRLEDSLVEQSSRSRGAALSRAGEGSGASRKEGWQAGDEGVGSGRLSAGMNAGSEIRSRREKKSW
jgi:hypothetical protein